MRYHKEILTIVSTSVCFFLFAYLTDFTVDELVNIQTSFIKLTMSQSGTSAIVNTLSLFVPSFVAMIFLVLGFMIIVGYALNKDDKRSKLSRNIGLACGIIGAIIVLFMFNFSITSFFIAISLIISAVYIVPLSKTYEQELKRWKLFRIGSNSSGKILLIFNILVSIGILVAVSMNMTHYRERFANEFSSTLKTLSVQQATALADTYIETYRASAIAAIDKTYPSLSQAERQQLISTVNQQVAALKKALLEEVEKKADETSRSAVQNLPLFKAYITWLPILTAFTVFVILEFLRSLIFSNIAGIFSTVTIKVFGKK